MNKEVLKLATPNIISNLSVPLLSVVDIALMGHLQGPHFILAVGFGTTFFNFLYWGFGFLRMGTTGFTAQAYGKNDWEETGNYLMRGMAIALSGGFLLILLQTVLLKLGLYLISTTPEVTEALTKYYKVRIFAAPATLTVYVLTGWFLGMQNARIPMLLTVIINLVNILGNYFFVVFRDMEAAGVALGTVVAQYTGLAIGIIFLLKKYPSIFVNLNIKKVLDMAALKKFMQVNFDIIIRTLCLIFAIAYFKVQSGNLDTVTGAANMVLLEFFTLAAYGIDGFAFAAESISGKYWGGGKLATLKKAIKLLFIWGVSVGIFFNVIFLIFGTSIVHLMTNQIDVFNLAIKYLNWMVFSPVIMAVPFIWDGIYIGLTASKAMRNTMLFSTLFVFLPAQILFTQLLGNHGLWLSFLLFLAARGLSQTFIFKNVLQKHLRSSLS